MRVLHIIAAYKPAYIYGGPTMSVAMLCEELGRAGIQAEVFATTANGNTELPVTPNKPTLVDGVTVTYFKRITKDHTHFSPALLNAVWKRAHEFDVVHIHAWWNLVSVMACALAQRRGVPVVLSPRGTLSGYSFANKNLGKKKLIHRLWGKNLLAKCHMHVTADNESQAITRLITPLSITNIPNFVKLDEAKHIAPPAGDVLKLLFFSRIEQKKGLDILLDALALLTIPFHLTIAGNGNKQYTNLLKATVTNSHIAAKITWAGFYSGSKASLLQQHHLMVLPSHDENFANVVVESLGAGTAVLVSTHVGLAAYVAANNFGWVCQTNPASVAGAINDIGLHQKQQLDAIRQTAPAKVRANFTGDALVNQYLQLYKSISK